MATKAAISEVRFGRLCLITPPQFDAERFPGELDEALRSGDVASLIIDLSTFDREVALRVAERLVPVAQANDTAAILAGDVDLALRVGADGVHVDRGQSELRRTVERMHPDGIVGAAGLKTRHEAMLAGETDCDYLFFGRLDGDTEAGIFAKALDLAAWWSAVFEIPSMVMGGSAIPSVIEAVEAGVEFVALRDAVWRDERGAAAAVAEASRLVIARQGLAAT